MKSPTTTLQKSPPTPRYGLTPFCRNERPTLPTLPTSFGLIVSSAKSTISLRGRISSASTPGRCLTPSLSNLCQQFARIRGDLRRKGQIIGDFDILIASTAIHHHLTLVTRNIKDYQRIPNLKLYK